MYLFKRVMYWSDLPDLFDHLIAQHIKCVIPTRGRMSRYKTITNMIFLFALASNLKASWLDSFFWTRKIFRSNSKLEML